jgi:hypothetical protein
MDEIPEESGYPGSTHKKQKVYRLLIVLSDQRINRKKTFTNSFFTIYSLHIYLTIYGLSSTPI